MLAEPRPAAVSSVVWRMPLPLWMLPLAVAGLSFWLFWDGLSYMWGSWLDAPEYSHAILIPLVAAFLVWQQKDRLERIDFSQGSIWGVALVVLGGAMLVLGEMATIYTLEQYAYLVTVYGLVLSFTGGRALKIIFVPLFILVFMIPLPQFVFNSLSLDLQLFSSSLGVWMMQLVGISVYLQGNVIDLGGYQLQVADACSGLRYLFPLMTLGFLIAYFYKGALWKRIVIFLSSIPITLVMNSVRVGTIGFMVEHWGIGMAEGFLHEFQGWFVFMICAALLIGEMALLNRVGREVGNWRQLFGVEFPTPTPPGAARKRRMLPNAFITASVVLAVFAITAASMPRPKEIVPKRTQLSEFSMTQGDWRGRRESLESVYLDTLKLDDYLLADFAGPGREQINLYVAYYDSQRKGEAVHSPKSCLPGGGWQLKDFSQRTLESVVVDGHPLQVNRTFIVLGNQRQLVYYWFEQRGRHLTNEFTVKWYLFFDSLTRHRSDGALVRVIMPLAPGTDEQRADERLTDFTRLVVKDLHRYVPD